MKLLPFKSSKMASIGIELEYQILDPMNYDLISKAKDIIRKINQSNYQTRIKPEITQSMVEINSSKHFSLNEMYEELKEVQKFLLELSDKMGVQISGGGTHPFAKWTLRKIFPTMRFKNKSHQYRYLSKRSTVFGQHIHVGCASSDDAIYLTHALARYIPHLIAMSAASPFYEGVDTGYYSSRVTVFNAYPTSGVMPYLKDWRAFCEYYRKMRNIKIIESMKDFYWDIRPKPEFGTVEIRICDAPLTLETAIYLAAYLQTLAHFLFTTRPKVLNPDLYYLYNCNRFEASRYGYDGEIINPYNYKKTNIQKDILETLKIIQTSATDLNNTKILDALEKMVKIKVNDASWMRKVYKKNKSFHELMREQCDLWKSCQENESLIKFSRKL